MLKSAAREAYMRKALTGPRVGRFIKQQASFLKGKSKKSYLAKSRLAAAQRLKAERDAGSRNTAARIATQKLIQNRYSRFRYKG